MTWLIPRTIQAQHKKQRVGKLYHIALVNINKTFVETERSKSFDFCEDWKKNYGDGFETLPENLWADGTLWFLEMKEKCDPY